MKIGSAWIKIRKKAKSSIFVVRYDKSVKQTFDKNGTFIIYNKRKASLSKQINKMYKSKLRED